MVRGMLEGLAECDRLTVGRHPILRAAVLSFGFVYVHPLTDGDGRISRFLINDVLRRDGVLPEPFVLPISAVIAGSMRHYDRTLEFLSKRDAPGLFKVLPPSGQHLAGSCHTLRYACQE